MLNYHTFMSSNDIMLATRHACTICPHFKKLYIEYKYIIAIGEFVLIML